jgi:hypothetical protein
VYRWVTRLLPLSVVLLPVLGWLARWWWPTPAYIGFPLFAAAGLLLMLYAFHLRNALPGAVALPAGTESILRVSTAALIAVALFTAATNYATVEGTQLARGLEGRVRTLPGVVISSVEPLNLDAPGLQTTELGGESGYRYRYSGLRLLERSGGRFFLITDGWTGRRIRRAVRLHPRSAGQSRERSTTCLSFPRPARCRILTPPGVPGSRPRCSTARRSPSRCSR